MATARFPFVNRPVMHHRVVLVAVAALATVAANTVSALIHSPPSATWAVVSGADPSPAVTVVDAGAVGVLAAIVATVVAGLGAEPARRWFTTAAVALGSVGLIASAPGVLHPIGPSPDVPHLVLAGVGAGLVLGAVTGIARPTVLAAAVTIGALLPLIDRRSDSVPSRYRFRVDYAVVDGVRTPIPTNVIVVATLLLVAVLLVATLHPGSTTSSTTSSTSTRFRETALALAVPIGGLLLTALFTSAVSAGLVGPAVAWPVGGLVASAFVVLMSRVLVGGRMILPMAALGSTIGLLAGAGSASASATLVLVVGGVVGAVVVTLTARTVSRTAVPATTASAALALPLSVAVFTVGPPLTSEFGWTAYTGITGAVTVSTVPQWLTIVVSVILFVIFVAFAVLPRRSPS